MKKYITVEREAFEKRELRQLFIITFFFFLPLFEKKIHSIKLKIYLNFFLENFKPPPKCNHKTLQNLPSPSLSIFSHLSSKPFHPLSSEKTLLLQSFIQYSENSIKTPILRSNICSFILGKNSVYHRKFPKSIEFPKTIDFSH